MRPKKFGILIVRDGEGSLQDTSEGATEKPRILGIHGGTFLTADVASSTDSHLSSTSVILRKQLIFHHT